MRSFFQRLALLLFGMYLAVFPGSTLTVALDQVPAWGSWMGGALLMLQGTAVLCWLIGEYGRRGALAGLLVFLGAWGVEHVGVTTGFPFGRYYYTEMLQPQLFGVVPLAIVSAWLMVAIGAWQLATTDDQRPLSSFVVRRSSFVRMATLVLLLDLQIETVATAINRYWVWLDDGPYYGVPTANFVAWWLVGLAMGLIVAWVLPTSALGRDKETERQGDKRQETSELQPTTEITQHTSRNTYHVLRLTPLLPAYLYLLSTLMFTAINLVRGYTMAGLVGAAVLLVARSALIPAAARKRTFLAQWPQRARRD